MRGRVPHLAPRELTVLELMNRGLGNSQIAQKLGLTRGSATAVVGRVLKAFGGGGRYAVVARARKLGVVKAPKDGGLQPPRRVRPRKVDLTPTERRVLSLMNRGLDDHAIARELHVRFSSAQTYALRVAKKFGGGARHEIVQAARRMGLVTAFAYAGPLAPVSTDCSVPRFTAREIEVLDLMNQGLTNGEIANRLGVTLPSANSYVSNVSTRLGGATRFEVVQYARDLGLITPPAKGAGLQAIRLTDWQRTVLEHAARHLTNTQIGRRLGRSQDAVTDALKFTRQKLGVKTTVQAIDRAVDLGLLSIRKQEDALNLFTTRECEILEGLFAGLLYREIAEELGISIGNLGGRIQEMKSKVRARDIEELLDEVERLQLYLPRRPRKRLVKRESLRNRRPPEHGIKVLTPRQLDVIEAFSRRPAASILEIAAALGLSPNTVLGHTANIRRRLGVQKSKEIAQVAFELGLIHRRPRR